MINMFDDMNDEFSDNNVENKKTTGKKETPKPEETPKKPETIETPKTEEAPPKSTKKVEPKPTKFLEKMMKNKKAEEKILVGFRIDKEVDEGLETLVNEAKTNGVKISKQDIVNDLLKKELGL